MSRHEYLISRELVKNDPPFYALIMAAYRKADTANAAKLEAAWPDVCAEAKRRYWSPGAALSTDPEYPDVVDPDAVAQEHAGELTEI